MVYCLNETGMHPEQYLKMPH